VRVRFAGCHVPVDRRQRRARQLARRGASKPGSDETVFTRPRSRSETKPGYQRVGSNNVVSSYLPMTNPVNAAIYAFGGFMLFAFAIGFFAAPV
jgi:hypothetical protein